MFSSSKRDLIVPWSLWTGTQHKMRLLEYVFLGVQSFGFTTFKNDVCTYVLLVNSVKDSKSVFDMNQVLNMCQKCLERAKLAQFDY